MASHKLLLFGRFGGLSEDDVFREVPNVVEVIPITPVGASVAFGGYELLSRSAALPPLNIDLWEELPEVPNTFAQSGFYTPCRLLHELHFRRHFINSGWQPMSLSSLESLHLHLEIAHQLITQSGTTKLVFEAVPHNTFDTVLYFVGRHLELDCLVYRDVGHFGGTRVFRNPLDGWPQQVFSEALVFPNEMRVSNFPVSKGVESIRLNTVGIPGLPSRLVPGPIGLSAWVRKIKSLLSESLKRILKLAPPTVPTSTARGKSWHQDLRNVFEPERRDQRYSQELPLRRVFSSALSSVGFERRLLRPDLFNLREIDGNKFLYFVVSRQPEMTTSVLGLVYEDHHYFLRRLLKVFPKEYLIVVRDHPLHDSMTAYPRSRSFLESFLSSSRVRIAAQHIPVDSLIEACKAVALVNGSAGFEALNLGRPVIYGGSPEYVNWVGTVQLDDLGNRSHREIEDWIVSETSTLSSVGANIDDFSADFRATTAPILTYLPPETGAVSPEKNKELILQTLKFIAAGQIHRYRDV